jgi:hypothetical protein
MTSPHDDHVRLNNAGRCGDAIGIPSPRFFRRMYIGQPGLKSLSSGQIRLRREGDPRECNLKDTPNPLMTFAVRLRDGRPAQYVCVVLVRLLPLRLVAC